jgi:predicted nucleic-acid-binding protein
MRNFIDTNVFLRYFLDKVREDKEEYWVPSVVLNEISWMLTNNYKINKQEVIGFIESILAADKFKVVYGYSFPNALNQYKKTNIKLTDCMIWSYMKPDDQIVSYDHDFDKLPGIKRIEPKDLIG